MWRRTHRPNSRLKARLIAQAIDSNIDVIRQRLPERLRKQRRAALPLRLGLPLVIVMTAGGVWPWPGAPEVPSTAIESTISAEESTISAHAEAPAAEPVPLQRVSPDLLALAVRRVVVDAGHGGESPGTASVDGMQEKDITLDIAQRLQPLLTQAGFETVMTRTGDDTLSLQQRAAIANDERGDIFLSIHLNWLDTPDATGIETYYSGPGSHPELDAIAAAENERSGYSLTDLRSLLDGIFDDAKRGESKQLAHDIQRALMQTMRTVTPSLTDRGVKAAPFVVLIATQMPAVLAEVSYLSNAAETMRLSRPEYRQSIATALANGVKTFTHSRFGTGKQGRLQ